MTARRRSRPLAAPVLTGLLVSALLLPAVAAPAGAARPSSGRAPARAQVVGATTVTVTLQDVEPPSPAPGQALVLSGTLTNTTDTAVDNLQPVVGVGSAITTRSDLLLQFETPAPAVVLLGVSTKKSAAPAGLAPHASAPFRVQVTPTASLATDRVYPLVVAFDGIGPQGAARLGEADTFLPLFPTTVSAPLRVAWLWPIDAPPALDSSGAVARDEFPGELGPGGRLRRLLDEARPLTTRPARRATRTLASAPVTWALEPSLLEAANVTAHDGWRRAGETSSRRADPDAQRFIADLTTASHGSPVVVLPYGDPDLVALARAGLTTDLTTAVQKGTAVASAVLGPVQGLPLAWPVQGLADQPTVDALVGAGSASVLLAGTLLPPRLDAIPPSTSSVASLETLGQTSLALATDPDVEALVDGGGRDQPTPQLAAQRLIALLGLIVSEDPNATGLVRDVVIAPPRSFDPDAAWSKLVLRDTATLPWLRAITVADATADPPGQRQQLQPYPPAAEVSELSPTALDGSAPDSIAALRALLADIRVMLPDNKLTRPLDDALYRAESAFWRPDGDPSGGVGLRDGVLDAANAMIDAVRVAAAGQVTLTSNSGTIPVTVANALHEAVTVRLSLLSPDRTKLTAPPGEQIVIAAQRKQRVLLHATTQRAGTFRVELVLSTPNGRVIQRLALAVHSSAYGVIGIAITVGALVVLLGALLLRAIRRLRRQLRARSHAGTP